MHRMVVQGASPRTPCRSGQAGAGAGMRAIVTVMGRARGLEPSRVLRARAGHPAVVPREGNSPVAVGAAGRVAVGAAGEAVVPAVVPARGAWTRLRSSEGGSRLTAARTAGEQPPPASRPRWGESSRDRGFRGEDEEEQS